MIESEATLLKPTDNPTELPAPGSWRTLVAPYQQPSLWRSLWQLANTFIPLAFVLYLMFSNLSTNFWLTLSLAPIGAGLQVRLFIFFHDCGHGSFFSSRKLNELVGFICGVFCFTPYREWWHLHAMHHATSGNLDRRAGNQTYPVELRKYIQNGFGLLILTTQEYQQLNHWQKIAYRIYRHPLFLLVLIPAVQFLVFQRFTSARQGKREKRSVHTTNLALLVITLIMGFTVGFGSFAVVMLLVVIPAAIAGVWLFYIQHQYEEVYWKPQGEWSYEEAAIKGSSYYKLPKVLQWFSGNIGFHHVHHLSPRIPNYYLARCHASHPYFQKATVITLRTGLKSLTLRLWDSEQQKLVQFKRFKAL